MCQRIALAIDAHSLVVDRKRATFDENTPSIAQIRAYIGRNSPKIDPTTPKIDGKQPPETIDSAIA